MISPTPHYAVENPDWLVPNFYQIMRVLNRLTGRENIPAVASKFCTVARQEPQGGRNLER